MRQYSLLTTAVAKMAAMPACWGSSWMSERSAAGYRGSSFTAGCSGGDSWAAREEKEEEEEGGRGDREARSFPLALTFVVTLQNSSSPGSQQIYTQTDGLTDPCGSRRRSAHLGCR